MTRGTIRDRCGMVICPSGRSRPGSARCRCFALVTQDADFAEMAALYGPLLKVVWLRGCNRPTAAGEDTLRRSHALILDFADEPGAACQLLY